MKENNKSLKKNFMMNVMLTMSSFIFPLVTFPYVSRILEPDGTGKISFATSLISYFLIFAQLGIPTYGIRACAKVRNDREKLTRTVHELLFINILMSLFVYILLGIALAFVPRLKADRKLYLVMSLTIILTALGMEWLYKALEQYVYITIRSMVFKFIALIIMFLAVRQKNDYVIYGGVTIFAASASNIFNFINIHKYIDMRLVGKYCLQKHLKAIMVFFAMTCAATIYTNLDTVMLGFIKTDVDVGYYNAAVKIKNILVSVVTSLGAVLLPRASYCIEHGLKDEFEEITRKSLNFVFIIALPMMLYFIMYAEEGIYFLSGKSYAGAILPMKLIMPTLLFIGITNILGMQILVPLGKEVTVLISMVIGAVTDIIINILLIPRLGTIGAVVGTVIAEFFVFIVQYIILKNIVERIFKRIHYLKIILAVSLGSLACFWVKMLKVTYFIKLLISAVFFFGVYSIVLFITKEELIVEIFSQIKQKLKKR